MSATDWSFKIHAYLHDPPDKPFALGIPGGHEAWGRELAGLLAEPVDSTAWEFIHRADRLASGADRTTILPAVRPRHDDLRHPLSGERIDLGTGGELSDEVLQQARLALREEVAALKVAGSVSARFVALWAFLTDRLRAREGAHELGARWDWLPADTRMPSHSIAVHQGLTSSLASVLRSGGDPVLLSFVIGPVQSFIQQARRTSDLWAGSHLLGEALLCALAPVITELGPDHVVFPALRRSDRFRAWLTEESPWAAELAPLGLRCPKPSSSGLPNRFLAVVPAGTAERVARAADEAVRTFWRDLARRHGREMESADPAMVGYADMAAGQANALFQCYWASSPWPASDAVRPEDEAVRQATWAQGGPGPSLSAFLTEGTRGPADRIAFRPNGGALYGAAYRSVETLVAAVKRTRPVSTRAEGGLKCSLCGERAVVPSDRRFEEQKEIWGRLRKRLEGDLRRGEALCGVCWARRRVGRDEARRVPSTAEIAAAPFKAQLLGTSGRLADAVDELWDAVEAHGDLSRGWAVPLVSRQRRSDRDDNLLRIDGEALLASIREDDELDDRQLTKDVISASRRLRREADRIGIQPPRPYLALLAFDGDHMGRWLSGELNLPLREYLSARALQALSDIPAATNFLDLQWPMTPAMHASVSEACAVFSQRSAPRTIHHDGLPGYLVYAGGDDVLALLPVGCRSRDAAVEIATEAALRLRLRFSGHVQRADDHDAPDPANPAGFVVDPSEGLGLAMGWRATASAGLAVFHQKWPLGRALREARDAEHRAKELLGRNALAIALLRRSGQVTHTGLRFLDGGASPVSALQLLAHAFAFDVLSPKFLAEVAARLAPLGEAGLPSGRLLDLARPLVHQALSDHYLGGQAASADESALVEALGHLERGSGGAGGDGPHLERWIALIETAAFLGRGVEP